MLIFSKKSSLNGEMIFTKIHSGLIISAMAVCPNMAGVPSSQVRGCPLIRVSFEDRSYCIYQHFIQPSH